MKFIGSEVVVRWLFKLRNNGSNDVSLHVDDVLRVMRRLRDVLCESVWRYNLLVWGDSNVQCLMGLLRVFAENTLSQTNTISNTNNK